MVAESLHATTDPSKLLVGAAAAARLCDVSKSTWWKLWSAGAVPEGRLLGRQRKWAVAELRAWIAAGMPARSVWAVRQEKTATAARLARMA